MKHSAGQILDGWFGFQTGDLGSIIGCTPHSSDYVETDYVIDLSELLRAIQYYNLRGIEPCALGEDGFCPKVEE